MRPPARAAAHRVFFALWPGAALRARLGRLALELQRECGGRAVPARNLHLTLVFVGAVGAGRLAALEAAASSVRGAPFALELDRLRYWRHNRIAWAGAARVPAVLPALASALRAALAREGFVLDARPYVPHVTLLRDAARAPAGALAPLAWEAADFALVESAAGDRGPLYRVLRRWPLARGPAG